MIDGTDVDAVIKKKRAHKTIMAEAFSPIKTNRFKLAKPKSPSKRERTKTTENSPSEAGQGFS